VGPRPTLTVEAARIVGALMEKERTVPDTYPLTLKGLVTACNQTSNRTPVVTYDELQVQRTLDQLKDGGLVRFVHPSHGERTTKFRQVIDEKLELDRAGAAVLCVLLLRGPQTVAELRTRTERLHGFESLGDVMDALDGLAADDEPLVQRLGRQPGEREERWMHLLSGDAPPPAPVETPPAPPAFAAAAPADSDLEERVAALEARVALLESLLED
jgi:uncharacterized protein YceH (UPF0502 family)